MHQNSVVSKALVGKYKINNDKYRFWILKITIFLPNIGYLVKLLNNYEATLRPKNLENINNFGGLTLVAR